MSDSPINLQQEVSDSQAFKRKRYQHPRLDDVEDVEKYTKGGFHPIELGDSFKHGRYRVIHKLGFGGFSTVWLARDTHRNALVALKVLTAEASQSKKEQTLLQYLDVHGKGHHRRANIIAILDEFAVNGPNGQHTCFVSRVAGPSLTQVFNCPGEVIGTRRLKGRLVPTLARQLAEAVAFLHEIGIAHGDITPKNVLLQLHNLDEMSDGTIYSQLGQPISDPVIRADKKKLDETAPKRLIAPVSLMDLDKQYLDKRISLIDMGEAFQVDSPPAKGTGVPFSYCAPEAMIGAKASKASDVWGLACTIFEMRAGSPLFESFLGSRFEVLGEMVRLLGQPPYPHQDSWIKYGVDAAEFTMPYEPELRKHIQKIGQNDYEADYTREVKPESMLGSLLEPLDTDIDASEVADLLDLLQRSLEYESEYRLTAAEVARHKFVVGGGLHS